MKPGLRRWLPLIFTFVLAALTALGMLALLTRVAMVPLHGDAWRFERPWAALLFIAPLLLLVLRLWQAPTQRVRIGLSRTQSFRLKSGRRVLWAPLLHALQIVALSLFVLAMMGPQSIHARHDSQVEGIEIMLVMDVSLSMKAADIRPNRFDAMRQVVNDFIVKRANDRIGAVIFGREAYTLLPLTTDHPALRNLILNLELEMIDGRGTAIGNAVGTSLNRMRHSEAKTKIAILLTDGDSNSGNISPIQATELAKTMGVRLYTILMGERDQTRVQRGTDLFGRPLWDRSRFPINPKLLERMAHETKGQAFRATNREALETSFHRILNALEKSAIDDAGRMYAELFPWFVWPGLALLMLEWLLSISWLRRWP